MKTRTIAVLAALLGAAGCADNHASIEIYDLCAPPEDAQACGESGACSAYLASARPFLMLTYQGSGGAVYTNSLEMFVQVNNQIPPNGDPTSGRVNTADFVVEFYKLSFTAPGFAVPSMDYAANATIPAGGVSSPVIPLIPREVAASIAASMTARGLTGQGSPVPITVHLQLQGHLTDGSSYTTGTRDFAVDVYNALFTGYACPKLGDVVYVCPNVGQTASVKCVTPS